MWQHIAQMRYTKPQRHHAVDLAATLGVRLEVDITVVYLGLSCTLNAQEEQTHQCRRNTRIMMGTRWLFQRGVTHTVLHGKLVQHAAWDIQNSTTVLQHLILSV